MMDKIRKITVQCCKEDLRNFIFLKSNLSWMRIEQAIQFLGNLLPQDSKVLELGCGCGHTTAMLAVARKDIKIIGTDTIRASSWEYLEKFGCVFQQCDATNLPFASCKFDAVVSFGVIEHVHDEGNFFKEVFRCLRKGGHSIFFNLPNRYSVSEFFAKVFNITHHKKRYSQEAIMRLLEDKGFKVISIKRMHLIPAEVHRISTVLGNIFNKIYRLLFKFDTLICKIPISLFCQDFRIVSLKS